MKSEKFQTYVAYLWIFAVLLNIGVTLVTKNYDNGIFWVLTQILLKPKKYTDWERK